MGVPLEVGSVVGGKYRLEREIGSGGMGVVFAATHIHLDQPVALKFLHVHSMTPETIARFWREARAAVKVQSQHVARVLDIGEIDTVPYIVMEYLEGDDLENIVQQCGPLPVHDAVRYVLQACEALAEVHALGMVHRDIKPANLFLASRADGTSIVKLLDFGISKQSWESDQASNNRLTHTSAVIGSPRYMSPEQLRSSRDVDQRTDVWALGVTLFELLGGDSPFASGTMPEVCASILKDQPTSLVGLRPEVPVELEGVIGRCLMKKADGRWRNVAELAMALRPFGPSGSDLSIERVAGVLSQAQLGPAGPGRHDQGREQRHEQMGLGPSGPTGSIPPPNVPKKKTVDNPLGISLSAMPSPEPGTGPTPRTSDSGRTSTNPRGTQPTELAARPSQQNMPVERAPRSSQQMPAARPSQSMFDRPPTTPPQRKSQPMIAVRPAEGEIALPRAATAFHDPKNDDGLEDHYWKQIGDPRSVPIRIVEMAKLSGISSLNLDHRAGFLISMMDGSSSIEDLLLVSGMSRLETLKLIVDLLSHQIIRLAPPN